MSGDHRGRGLAGLIAAAGVWAACSTAGMTKAPASLRDYEYLVPGTDSLDEALVQALRESHLTVRRRVQGGDTPTLVVLHFHEAPAAGETGTGHLLLQLSDTRRVGVKGEARVALDSLPPGALNRARALLDSLGLGRH